MSCYRPTHVYHWFHRILHWSIAGSIAFLLPLGIFIAVADDLKLPDAGEDVIVGAHVIIGLFFAAVLILRIIVLFAGQGAMSWRDVLPHTAKQFSVAAATIKYYLGGFRGKPPLYFAHNPFAGGIYAAFFCFAATQAASGLTMVILHIMNEGAAQKVGKAYAEAALIVHDIGAIFIIFYICAHLGALALHDIIERRGLASSMISGYKFFSDDELKELEEEKNKSR